MNTTDHLDDIATQIENEVHVLTNRAQELRRMANEMRAVHATVTPADLPVPYHDPNFDGSKIQPIRLHPDQP